jgi:hypothetical protein
LFGGDEWCGGDWCGGDWCDLFGGDEWCGGDWCGGDWCDLFGGDWFGAGTLLYIRHITLITPLICLIITPSPNQCARLEILSRLYQEVGREACGLFSLQVGGRALVGLEPCGLLYLSSQEVGREACGLFSLQVGGRKA